MKSRPNLLAGEKLQRAPKQKRSHEKRLRLHAAALALFAEKGYEGTSVGAIARRARLPVGSFYQHYGSKRQLLLVLMDELLEKLSTIDLRPGGRGVRSGIEGMLRAAFSRDLEYLGVCRAWQEAALSNPDIASKQYEIQAWTTARARGVFELLQKLPGARNDVDINGLARGMDAFFWSLLGRAIQMRKAELDDWIHTATHLIYHAILTDSAEKRN